jgi:DNA-binding transcriptional MerR regulator
VAERAFLSIGDVRSILKEEFPDVTISKIRFLESQGLLDPERTPSGYRKFSDPDVQRLRWILRQQREHFLPLKVIKQKLSNGALTETATAAVPEPASVPVGSQAPGPSGGGTEEGMAAPGAPGAPGAQEGPLTSGPSALSMTKDELVRASGLSPSQVAELERYGLLTARVAAGASYYDEEAFTVASLAAGFARFGIEPRHLRMYKMATDREAGFFEQIVTPLLKQRNPESRRRAVQDLAELTRLGQRLRGSLLRVALRGHTGA